MNVDRSALNLLLSSLGEENEADQAKMIRRAAPTRAICRRALELLKFHHSEDSKLLPKGAEGRVCLGDHGFEIGPLSVTRVGERDQLKTFELHKRLGIGTSSDLFFAKSITRESGAFAVKVPRLISKDQGLKRLARELLLMELASHPNVIRGVRIGTLGNDRPFLLMEHITGVRLGTFLARPSCRIEQVFSVLTQICITISELHQRGISHCDLNPDNIIINPQPLGFRPVLIDFGSSQPLRVSRRAHFAPLEKFGAGERKRMMGGRSHGEGEASFRKDIRALAMMAYAFLRLNRNEEKLKQKYGDVITHKIKSLYKEFAFPDAMKDLSTANLVAERFQNIQSEMDA